MKFDIYCASSCENEGNPTQISGCGIVLIAIDDNEIVTKKFEYGLGSSSKLRADLLCVRLALSSIKLIYRGCKTVLYVDNRRIQSAFEVAFEHSREFDEMIRWYGYYADISVEISNNQIMEEAKLMAITAMRTQKHREY